MKIPTELSDYISSHTTPEDPVLTELYRETHLKVLHPRMLSGHYQGKFLELISRIVRPDYVLEIGTYTGYSAICLAKGLSDHGRVITIDRNEEIAAIANKYFVLSGLQHKIELITGDALEIIPDLDHTFDLVFIDGDKKEYPDYYRRIIEKTRTGGIILADNVLWDGKVLLNFDKADQDTRSIIDFNEMVIKDSRVENIILPLRDGLMMMRKTG